MIPIPVQQMWMHGNNLSTVQPPKVTYTPAINTAALEKSPQADSLLAINEEAAKKKSNKALWTTLGILGAAIVGGTIFAITKGRNKQQLNTQIKKMVAELKKIDNTIPDVKPAITKLKNGNTKVELKYDNHSDILVFDSSNHLKKHINFFKRQDGYKSCHVYKNIYKEPSKSVSINPLPGGKKTISINREHLGKETIEIEQKGRVTSFNKITPKKSESAFIIKNTDGKSDVTLTSTDYSNLKDQKITYYQYKAGQKRTPVDKIVSTDEQKALIADFLGINK